LDINDKYWLDETTQRCRLVRVEGDFAMENNSFIMQAESEELEDEFAEEEIEEEEATEEYAMSFACEDCDYRWEMSFESEELSEEVQFCPMCGSANTTQI